MDTLLCLHKDAHQNIATHFGLDLNLTRLIIHLPDQTTN